MQHPPPAKSFALSQPQKAAIVVHLLLAEGADPGIADLPTDAQRRLVSAFASLRFVDRGTLAKVVTEFARELDADGLRLPGTLSDVLGLLDGRIAPEVLAEMAAGLGTGASAGLGTASWAALADMPVEAILPLLDAETAEVCAIMLSKLPPARAAAILGEMDPERAAEVTVAFAGTEDVPPDAVARIGVSLGGAVAKAPEKGFDASPVQRVGAILNAATSGARETLMGKLDNAAPDFATRVRSAVFSWENIPERLDAADVPRAIREVDGDIVIIALGGDPESEVATYLLGSISARLADQYRLEIEDKGAIDPAEAEAAQSEIAAAIRRMEEAGQLSLKSPSDGQEDAEA